MGSSLALLALVAAAGVAILAFARPKGPFLRFAGAAFLAVMGLISLTRGQVLLAAIWFAGAAAVWSGWTFIRGRKDAMPNPSAAMTHQDALAALGLSEGASRAEIEAAHRRLMMRVHPDRGGTDFLAAQLNAAKARLIDDLSD